ncbi:MAG: SDR family NAD(P)-dependent oxidoreductase, partial [Chloroflexi bacterium]
MDLGLKGRVAAITGGSRGIGFAIAQALLAEDCQVAICARDQAGLDRAVQLLGSGVFGHRADVTRPGEVEAFIEA